MRVLIGCECSATVLKAFLDEGHDAWSCDLKPCEDPRFANRHIMADVREVIDPANRILYGEWDLLAVMHPPCTRLCNSGVRWLKEPPKNPPADATEEEARTWVSMSREEKLAVIWSHLDAGAALFSDCWNADIPRIAIENPVMHRHAKERISNYQEFTQSVQPWQFGHDPDGPDNEKKRTCFWLKGLPALEPTGTLDGTNARNSVHYASPGADRATERSRFFPGMAQAMAEQWGMAATLNEIGMAA